MRKDLLTDTMQPKKELVRIVIDKEKNVSVILLVKRQEEEHMFHLIQLRSKLQKKNMF